VREAAAHILIVLAGCPGCFAGVMRRQMEWYSRVVALLLFGDVIGYGIGAGSLAFVIVPVAVLLLLLLTGQFRLPRPAALRLRFVVLARRVDTRRTCRGTPCFGVPQRA
jgi:hypothetical protein